MYSKLKTNIASKQEPGTIQVTGRSKTALIGRKAAVESGSSREQQRNRVANVVNGVGSARSTTSKI